MTPNFITHEDEVDNMFAQNPEYDFLFKVLVIGAENAGKSCVSWRFCNDWYTEEKIESQKYDPLRREIKVEYRIVKTMLFEYDTESFLRDAKNRNNFSGVNVVVHVIDLMLDETQLMQDILTFSQYIDRLLPDNVTRIIMANKCDAVPDAQEKLERVIEKTGLANLLFSAVSAKCAIGVEDAFRKVIAARLLKQHGVSSAVNAAVSTDMKSVKNMTRAELEAEIERLRKNQKVESKKRGEFSGSSKTSGCLIM